MGGGDAAFPLHSTYFAMLAILCFSPAVALWRLHLSGGDAGMLLSLLAREHGLNVALVQARVEDVQGVPVGTLFTLVQASAPALQAALRDVTTHHATVEELRHEPATR